MKIDKRLNLVIPILDDEGERIRAYVHSTPIKSSTFDAYYMTIAKSFSRIHGSGLGVIAGPRVADKILRDVAKEDGVWDTPDGVRSGLVNEIQRLTNVLRVGDKGWESLPYEQAKKQEVISAEDASEVDAAIAFFTLASAMHRKQDLPALLGGAASLWGAQITSFNSSEFMSSLKASTAPENTGETPTAS